MKKRELEKYKKSSKSEIKKQLDNLKLELRKVSVKISVGEESNLKAAKNLKRDIAQLSTLLKFKAGKQEESVKKEK